MYIVLPSKEFVERFRTQVKMSKRNFEELLHQIFDGFLDRGIEEQFMMMPVMSMLVKDPEMASGHPDILNQAFRQLVHDLRVCLLGLGLKEIMLADHGEFNYCFHSLRGSDIVVFHLSNDSRKI